MWVHLKKIKNPQLIFFNKCERSHIRPVNKHAKLTLPPNTPRIKSYLSLCLQHPAKTMDISSMPCCAFVWTVYIFAWGQKQDDGCHTFRKHWKSESCTTWVLYAQNPMYIYMGKGEGHSLKTSLLITCTHRDQNSRIHPSRETLVNLMSPQAVN